MTTNQTGEYHCEKRWHINTAHPTSQNYCSDRDCQCHNHTCCDGECRHDDCCGKVPENCPLLDTGEESIGHLVTVLSVMLEDKMTDESYKQACDYVESWVKYRMPKI